MRKFAVLNSKQKNAGMPILFSKFKKISIEKQ